MYFVKYLSNEKYLRVVWVILIAKLCEINQAQILFQKQIMFVYPNQIYLNDDNKVCVNCLKLKVCICNEIMN